MCRPEAHVASIRVQTFGRKGLRVTCRGLGLDFLDDLELLPIVRDGKLDLLRQEDADTRGATPTSSNLGLITVLE